MYRIPFVLILSLTLGLAQAQAAPDAPGHRPKGPPPVPTAIELQRDLGLDASLAGQVHALMQAHAQARRQMNEGHRAELKALLTPGQFERLKPLGHGPATHGAGPARAAQQ
ncbi:hypothetical protein [Roseateles oligotrophus]|uniref:Uncharacterized protein n=1 Tax=Roseateles oligotrophus TaxID=1769250 RepID=A0ABT2Y9L1_9BURK|nr:hypothetical protein [Roseateles oligotrophus]MCV2366997.1 hypothetical protein [Roseateles oligotrophus]